MNHLFEHYLSRLRSKNDLERTVRNNATILGLYETWALAQGHEPMAIAPMDAQAYLDFCRAEGKAPSTIARYRTILKATWQFAADMELLPGRNPWRLTVAPRQQLAEPAIWETCDLRAMLDASLDPLDRML